MGAWVKNMAKCLVEFGWQCMEGDAIKGTEKRYKSSARQLNSLTVQCQQFVSLYRGKLLFLIAIKGLSESENCEICYQVFSGGR